MIPELQRFYGGSPLEWLDMPQAVLFAYYAMLPRLRAQEALQEYAVLTMATAPLAPAAVSRRDLADRKKVGENIERVRRQLELQASGGRLTSKRRVRRDRPWQATELQALLNG